MFLRTSRGNIRYCQELLLSTCMYTFYVYFLWLFSPMFEQVCDTLCMSIIACLHIIIFTGEKVQIVEYENTPRDLIKSFLDRFNEGDINAIIQQLWDKDAHHFS